METFSVFNAQKKHMNIVRNFNTFRNKKKSKTLDFWEKVCYNYRRIESQFITTYLYGGDLQ